MCSTERNRFSDWEKTYETLEFEEMPWWYEKLDPDIDAALKHCGFKHGGFKHCGISAENSGPRVLDLGCGPGTQAFELAQRGFDVLASDLSPKAIEKVKKRFKLDQLRLRFIQDDILESKLEGPFDLVIDRGCFHVIKPEARASYIATLSSLLEKNKYYFLKCFSEKETMEDGPHRFSEAEIRELFSSSFEILSIDETVYYGTLEQYPIALFSVMKKL